jgi:hypothetical protein
MSVGLANMLHTGNCEIIHRHTGKGWICMLPLKPPHKNIHNMLGIAIEVALKIITDWMAGVQLVLEVHRTHCL